LQLPTSSLIPHIIRPARGGALGVIVVFAVLLGIAAKSGFTGIPLGLIIGSWFFKYAYILFDHTVRGFEEPPVLDIQMLNPISEQRPLAQLIILGLIVFIVKGVNLLLNGTAGWVVAAALVFLLPASVAVLGLERDILQAMNPLLLARMLQGLGRWYGAVLGIIVGYVLLLDLLGRLGLWLPVEIAIVMFAILSIFSVLGGARKERRDHLGIEAWHTPERKAERIRQDELKISARTIDAAYEQSRIGAHAEAWKILTDWLASRGNAIEDYRWLSERMATWADARYDTRMAQHYIDRLLALKKTGEVLDVVARRLRVDPDFRPQTATATLEVARIAAFGGSPGTARALLTDFSTRFPGDPNVIPAGRLAAQIAE
jgi:hypothetical protein